MYWKYTNCSQGKTLLVRWKVQLGSHQDIDVTNKIIDVEAPSGHDMALNNFNVFMIVLERAYEINSSRTNN